AASGGCDTLRGIHGQQAHEEALVSGSVDGDAPAGRLGRGEAAVEVEPVPCQRITTQHTLADERAQDVLGEDRPGVIGRAGAVGAGDVLQAVVELPIGTCVDDGHASEGRLVGVTVTAPEDEVERLKVARLGAVPERRRLSDHRPADLLDEGADVIRGLPHCALTGGEQLSGRLPGSRAHLPLGPPLGSLTDGRAVVELEGPVEGIPATVRPRGDAVDGRLARLQGRARSTHTQSVPYAEVAIVSTPG